MRKAVFGYLLLFIALSAGCKRNEPMEEVYELEGKWDIYEAYRNNELTNTLEDGYFLFSDSIMETNILGSPISGAYTLSSTSFSHNSSLPAEYKIISYSKDTLEVDTEIRNYRFKFRLLRERDSIPGNY
jgi:hypothetical protein